jgi:biopolymer transport protein ExbD
MRSRYQSVKSNSESEVNILPLIDVLFAILLFFMLSSIVLTEKNQIAVKRPTTSQAEQVGKAKKTITITLKNNRKLYLEEDELLTAELSQRLKRLSQDNSIDQVLIDADKACVYGEVMEILDIVKAAGLNSIGLAVNKRDIYDQEL